MYIPNTPPPHYLPYLSINMLFLYIGYPYIIYSLISTYLSMNWIPLNGITENKQYFLCSEDLRHIMVMLTISNGKLI